MNRPFFGTLVLLAACLLPAGTAAQTLSPAATARIDALFAPYDKPDSPGAAVAVLMQDKSVHSRGYGMANLEYRAPITPTTPFHMASVSKQFTAMAIHLLVQEGKLSLDDEVRRHLPELQVHRAGATPITVRHLIHHTSGLRDQWSLLMLAGLRLDDVITDGDILGLVWRQRDLNFAPGDEELYSNTGYTLLAQIVQRVSGRPFAAFTKERIFEPLGMKSTHFQEQYGTLVPGRAYSYEKTPAGWQYVALSYSNVGATSLFSTLEDLARWNQNLQDWRVGGPSVAKAMLARGKLNSGKDLDYASGLVHGRMRGLPTLAHAGSDAAFRTMLLRFPEQRLSVLVLANAGDLNAFDLARKVADVVLDSMPGVAPAPAAPPTPAEVALTEDQLAPYLGSFEMRPGFVLEFTREGRQLRVQATGQPRFEMFAAAPDTFFTKAFPAEVRFDAPSSNGQAASATWRQNGRDLPLRRIVRTALPPEQLQACTGTFYSAELGTLYVLSMRDGKLVVRYPRGERALTPVTPGVFSAEWPLGTITFQQGASAGTACDGFAVTTGRVRNLRFVRVAVPGAS
jgi:CubicO group peptidase (beta-lactamase class C family)